MFFAWIAVIRRCAFPARKVAFVNLDSVTIYLALCLTAGIAVDARAADIAEAERLYKSGQYAECIELTAAAIADGDFSETWRVLKIQAELATGRYTDANKSLKLALDRYPASVRLRWIGGDVHRFNGNGELAAKTLDEIAELFSSASWRYRDPTNQIALGRFFLHRGADAKQVLNEIYSKVKKASPGLPEAFVASGELALDKHDYGLAAEAFEQAAKLDPLDPEVHFGLARSYAPSDTAKSNTALEMAQRRNPNHVPSLLLIVDNQIDAESYDKAETTISKVLAINAKQPLAWAYRAVLAHLNNDPEQERKCRNEALATWAANPEVDYLIGKKLSQKYRFAEGSTYQRKSLVFDPNYLPAKLQLSQDLLRLGQELEGWKLADEVFDKDGYDVVAHNLVTLRDRLTKFRILEGDGFVIRMEAHESTVYGQRVLDSLRRAKQTLCAKYDVQLDEPVYVEIFPQQQDFAIRTFGLPGGAGFLGVCFGHVVTMNSPASQGSTPSNWQSVLWHEFCHVVTLTKTNNKMPRWLSEGISVYEERQANPAWGQSLNPQYRKMILAGELTPVSALSGAFLDPKSPLHLQFAYYESSLVVEYLVEKYGLDMLQRILVDLGVGMPINDSIRRYAGSLELLDQEFGEFARQRAENLAPDADFAEPDLPPLADTARLAAWNVEHPNNFVGLQRYAKQLLAEKNWQAAKEPLEKLLKLYPAYHGPDNAHWMLSLVYRELGDTERERAALNELAKLDDDATDVYLRLAELGAAAGDWEAVLVSAERLLEVNPLLRAPQKYLAEAAERTGDDARAIEGLTALAEMDPLDPADIHFRTAQLLYRSGNFPAARLQVLKSLEEAPRYRDAHRLLLKIVAESDREPATPEPSATSPAATREKP